jgi:hypothetical protein
MLDRLSTRLASLLDGTYDCVDRLVLNAYFQFGQTPAGFRLWWRSLHGSDADLDNAHLMRMAGRLARRLRAHAEAHNIPVIDCAAEERKHVVAEQYLPSDPDFVGVFVILVGRAPAPVWDVQLTKSGTIVNIRRKTQYVKHYYFHILDPDWGHVTIRMSGHPPFGAQVILNGHDYVACQARRAGIRFQKEDNCFTDVADAAQLAQLADTLRTQAIIGPLRQVCERWIYTSCLCFALDTAEQARSNFHYDYAVYQVEYSRNLLFRHGSQLEQLFQGLVDRTRSWLDVKRVQTIFGRKRRPYRHGQRRAQPRFEVVVERPVYDLTVFKLHFGKLTVKLYTKGERVLRSEAIVHNTKALHCGRSLPKFPEVVTELAGILQRFLDALDCVDSAFIADDAFDQLAQPGCVGQTRVAGVNLDNPRMRAVIEVVLALAAAPKGFLVAAVAAKVCEIRGLDTAAYRARHAAYDLKKLRGKNWVRTIAKSRSYEVVPEGVQAMTAILVLRDKVIKPLLAATAKPSQSGPPERLTPLDALYRTLQGDMCQLFQLLGIAVQTA